MLFRSGTLTVVNCCGSMDIQIFQDQGNQTVFGFYHINYCPSFPQPQGWIAMAPAYGPGFKAGKANVIVTAYNDCFGPFTAATTVSVKPQ